MSIDNLLNSNESGRQGRVGSPEYLDFNTTQFDDERFSNLALYPCSNDAGLFEAFSLIGPHDIPQPNISLFVGSGALYSILPKLGDTVPVVVDVDKGTLEVNALIGKIITESASLVETMRNIEQSDELFAANDGGLGGRQYLKNLEIERESLKSMHWTEPDRLPLVRKALSKTSPYFVQANVLDPHFAAEIQRAAKITGRKIGLINMTNVHGWLEIDARKALLDGFPVHENANIIFSSYTGSTEGSRLQSHVVKGVDNYRKIAAEDTIDMY